MANVLSIQVSSVMKAGAPTHSRVFYVNPAGTLNLLERLRFPAGGESIVEGKLIHDTVEPFGYGRRPPHLRRFDRLVHMLVDPAQVHRPFNLSLR